MFIRWYRSELFIEIIVFLMENKYIYLEILKIYNCNMLVVINFSYSFIEIEKNCFNLMFIGKDVN